MAISARYHTLRAFMMPIVVWYAAVPKRPRPRPKASETSGMIRWPVLQQEQEIVCQMVGDRDGNEREHEAPGAQTEWQSRSAGRPSRQSHEGRENQVGRDECKRKPAR